MHIKMDNPKKFPGCHDSKGEILERYEKLEENISLKYLRSTFALKFYCKSYLDP